MKILNDEQLAYLKSLESPKKRRKFMLDCLVENALGESELLKQFEEVINSPLNKPMNQTCTAPETLKNIETFNEEEFLKETDSLKTTDSEGNVYYFKKWKYLEDPIKTNESAKHNYTPEEIEIAKSLNSEREEKKFTLEDMRKSYYTGIVDWLEHNNKGKAFYSEFTFQELLKSLKND